MHVFDGSQIAQVLSSAAFSSPENTRGKKGGGRPSWDNDNDSYQTVIRQLLDTYQIVIRQLLDS